MMASGQMQPQLARQIAVRALIAPVFIVALVFISAGRLDYWQGWVYVAITCLTLLVTLWALRDSPELISERLQPGQGMQAWDRWYFAVSTPLYIATVVVACLDAGRFHWSGAIPPWVYLLATTAYVLGQVVFLWAKRANRFFSSVVRIQAERGQTVCREGPYRFVRHPGYVGGLIYGVVTPLVLGSTWALVPAALAAILLVARTELEDRLLQRELPGYAAYAQAVRYRLLPRVW
jgi:protein-S-isoprenylcysteine O-methyltransferase Ste14